MSLADLCPLFTTEQEMNDLEKLSFEEAFGELEATVHRLDADASELALEEAIALYERGMHLARRCNDALDAAELQVQQLAIVSDQQQLGMFLEDG
jgi:exodeoxyribonuclease VII small subunit